jgi:site-specific DNA-methyltransferase (adenine-specific)
VLDPFLGSGSSAIAALQTSRRYIGVDLSKEYCQLAEARIAAAKEEMDDLAEEVAEVT